MLTPGSRYVVRTVNRQKNPSHYQVEFPVSLTSDSDRPKTTLRWVRVDCGTVDGNPIPNNPILSSEPTSASALSNANTVVSASTRGESKAGHFLLAISWQPAFCETHRLKPECRTQAPERYDSTHFSLHGLWPQPIENAYCGVNMVTKSLDRKKKWHLLPRPKLSKSLRNRLRQSMPGTASSLERHEWIKHGTCYSDGPEEYFSESLKLLEQVNSSALRDKLTANIGTTIDRNTVIGLFENSFGSGTGKFMGLRCDRGGRLTEIWINLYGKIEDSTRLAELLQNARPGRSNCRNTIMIDASGFSD